MSLNDSLSPVDRAKLAVWDYPVSEKFTKLYERMYVPDSYAEALRMVKAKEFAFIGKNLTTFFMCLKLYQTTKFSTFLDMSKSKAFADDKTAVTQRLKFVSGRVENAVGKVEIAS